MAGRPARRARPPRAWPRAAGLCHRARGRLLPACAHACGARCTRGFPRTHRLALCRRGHGTFRRRPAVYLFETTSGHTRPLHAGPRRIPPGVLVLQGLRGRSVVPPAQHPRRPRPRRGHHRDQGVLRPVRVLFARRRASSRRSFMPGARRTSTPPRCGPTSPRVAGMRGACCPCSSATSACGCPPCAPSMPCRFRCNCRCSTSSCVFSRSCSPTWPGAGNHRGKAQ